MIVVNRRYLFFTALFIMIIIPLVVYGEVPGEQEDLAKEVISSLVRGKVVNITEEVEEEKSIDDYSFSSIVQTLEVKITSGKYSGKTIEVKNIIDERMAYHVVVNEGDRISVYLEEDQEGNITSAYVDEILRDTYLLYLAIIFIVALTIIGGMKGIKAIITLGLTALAVVKVFFPLILAGNSPVIVSVFLCIGIITVTLFIIGGINKKSISAIIGTAGGIFLAGILALTFGSMARLTGLGDQEAQMLKFIPQEISFNFQGLLFAGIIIGALGAVMDVGMSVASAMNEVKEATPEIRIKDLVKAGMNVGHDIMGTMSNTLILAYTGGAIHLILLFMIYDIPVVKIINQDLIASEIVRALAGSIGLVFTVPFTVLAASLIYKKR